METSQGRKPHGVKAELVSANRLAVVVEKIIKLHDPGLAALRASNRRHTRGAPLIVDAEGGLLNQLFEIGVTQINRDVSRARVIEYMVDMRNGHWTFSPDPIVVSEEGQILNGQHRLLAASHVDWSEHETPPLFLVVWGVDKRAAVMMDEAKRTTRDRRRIALGLADA